MRREWFLIIFLGSVVFLGGCVKENPAELKFKNDVVTIENYFVSNVAPYEKGDTNIQLEIHNNGDRLIPYLEIDFFDIPGFEIVNSVECPLGKREGKSKCVFTEAEALEPLDVRSVTVQLKSTEDISSPTPHTVSFAVSYAYFGSREASIPVIDDVTRKQPLTKFRQSDPSTGPVVIDIDPSIEREIVTGDKTIKENWGVGGGNPLPFLTKFKFKDIGTIHNAKDVKISATSVRLIVQGLKTEDCKDFCEKDNPSCTTKIRSLNLDPIELVDRNRYFVDIGRNYYSSSFPSANNLSTKPILIPFDTLLCTFKPTLKQPEYSAIISAFFAYKYEFIKSQEFVIQPLPEPS